MDSHNAGRVLKYMGIIILSLVGILLYYVYTHQILMLEILEYFSFMWLIAVIVFVAFVVYAIIYGALYFSVGISVQSYMEKNCPKCEDRLWCEGSVSEVRACMRKRYTEFIDQQKT